MELDHIGSHCEFEACNQKDFLPFKCGDCSKNFCLLHRSTVSHNCSAQQNRDAISVECPVCRGSIKMFASDDPNVMWERHFSESCTQKPQSKSILEKCYVDHCLTVLGPSNTFLCSKCQNKVCLSHRNPDNHKCSRHATKSASDMIREKYSNAPSSTKNTNTVSKSNDTKKTSITTTKRDPSNTLKGSASRRKPDYLSETNNHTPTTIQKITCPFCMKEFSTYEDVTAHMTEAHRENSFQREPSLPVSTPPATSLSSREVRCFFVHCILTVIFYLLHILPSY